MMQKYFSWQGRLNRKPYWLRSLALFAVTIGVFALLFVGFGAAGSLLGGDLSGLEDFNLGIGAILIGILALVFIIAVTVSGMSIAARRLHDRNKSAWWLLVFYVLPNFLSGDTGFYGPADEPLAIVVTLAGAAISIWGLIEIGFLKGTDGPNRFGEDPLHDGEVTADVFA